MTTQQSKFRDTALASELVTEEQLRQALAEIVQSKGGNSQASTDVNEKKLAQKLVEMNVISAYQADQLLTGRTKLSLGPYIITDWIGQGGMGQVFKAVHQMLGRESAVKVLPLHKTTPEAIENFRREIRAQAQLDHHNLVRAFDAGEDGNVHYLVVEYVPGTDLRRLVRSKGKLSVQQAANIIKQSAEGLVHAHECELIHRDIKPGNILVTPDGVAKLSDLGLAYYLNDASDPRAGKIVGTADYLSPEQIRTPKHITSTSDIYSLGCTLYYAVTGKVPFPGGTPKSKAKRHLEETPWHPRRFNEEVSDDFVDLIGDMMEKDPKERIQTADEVAERLAPWATDDSPLLREDLGDRPRWTPAPIHSPDAQDTDPNDDVTELAMHEISDTSQISATINDSSISGQHTKPPPPLSTVEQYKAAGHINDRTTFSLTALAITALVCIAIGVLVGFISGYLIANQ
ncbi:MAG: serine/threonine-protein kinase [Mariniblastus sp.]|nr:serine/threonine-protein kinase [Mariniblastus sp.]